MDDLKDSPTIWFVQFEQAIRTGDHAGEHWARSELARLGVALVVDRELLRSSGHGAQPQGAS